MEMRSVKPIEQSQYGSVWYVLIHCNDVIGDVLFSGKGSGSIFDFHFGQMEGGDWGGGMKGKMSSLAWYLFREKLIVWLVAVVKWSFMAKSDVFLN